ncbi:MAG: CarD family transcriptional regulator [Clostridiales bacterium]|nr:CarD family transcriptional regulator [Clostridiales bacterium]
MFNKGDYVIYGSKGVCQVLDITTIEREGIPGNRLYYQLTPLNSRGSKVFTPVDNNKTVMRALITKEEAEALIKDMPNMDEVWVPNEKQREQTYKDCLRTGECREYIRVIKTLYQRKKLRIASGKKITSTDERYLKLAEEALYSEFALLFSVPRDEIPVLIKKKLDEAEKTAAKA